MQQACEGELPTPAEAATYDAIVIGGSHYSAYEEHDWIAKMLELLPQYAAQGTRMYGCCFGSQVGLCSRVQQYLARVAAAAPATSYWAPHDTLTASGMGPASVPHCQPYVSR